VSVPMFAQVEIHIFLPFYGENSVRSSQVPGFRIPITMETGKCCTRLSSPLFAKDYLPARQRGKPELLLLLHHRCLMIPMGSSDGGVGCFRRT